MAIEKNYNDDDVEEEEEEEKANDVKDSSVQDQYSDDVGTLEERLK